MAVKSSPITEKEAAGYFWKLLELNAVPIITWEFNGKITNANDTFLEMIGYTRREFEEGKINWKSLTPKEYLSLDEECVEQLKSEGMADPFEKQYIRKNGSLIKVRLYNAMLDPSEDHGVGIIIPLK